MTDCKRNTKDRKASVKVVDGVRHTHWKDSSAINKTTSDVPKGTEDRAEITHLVVEVRKTGVDENRSPTSEVKLGHHPESDASHFPTESIVKNSFDRKPYSVMYGPSLKKKKHVMMSTALGFGTDKDVAAEKGRSTDEGLIPPYVTGPKPLEVIDGRTTNKTPSQLAVPNFSKTLTKPGAYWKPRSKLKFIALMPANTKQKQLRTAKTTL